MQGESALNVFVALHWKANNFLNNFSSLKLRSLLVVTTGAETKVHNSTGKIEYRSMTE